MSVADVLDRCRAENRAALVGYLPVGFPTVEGSIEAMRTMVQAGVDIVEIGVPYSDPVMDGPVIQDAAVRALEGGVHLSDVFTAVKAVQEAGAEALVMTYWNPVLRYGVERFAADVEAAGGAGLITPDLIPDEAGEWIAAADAHDLDKVFLVAPSSTPERLAKVTAQCRGFVYATAVMGVTGARTSVDAAAEQLVARTREATDLPVCVGLGVSSGDQAAEIGRFADGVIVGSALVRCLTEASSPEAGIEAVGALARELADGVRRGR
ncbi:tryptophan synthase subunit alpha [Terracoccus luteus]|uniref:Tryptophan synthase alpha chain n=1 Tax=Terracoccus luteus TaxID=53356 RepID=A0A495XVA2_9MICO|nr:tryptophan synthase subunit alpha [Terracoccus luteus]MBB2987791.1 tryptophan synthase alpha chain [Terracoccus luteus]MCP2173442.1 tryptophan synthase alpha chain [Terracoccus luteus]RKT78177.1 tryptophan synthase alpha chain [Terracoccus luteus]